MQQKQSESIFQSQFPENIGNKFLQDAIKNCIRYKIIQYHRFLASKLGLEEIRHKKIVQKIFLQYLPNNYRFQLSLMSIQGNNVQENKENRNHLKEALKYVKLLKNLKLDIHKPDLGGKNECLLEEIVRLFPNLLQLNLDFERSKLGKRVEVIEYLGDVIKKYGYSLEVFELDLSENNLQEQDEAMEQIYKSVMKQLPRNLKSFELNLGRNLLGDNPCSHEYLDQGIKVLPQNLQEFRLDLQENLMGGKLGEGMKMLPSQLRVFELNLSDNYFGYVEEFMEELEIILLKLPKNLEEFRLDLSENYLGEQVEILEMLRNIMVKLPQNLKGFELVLQTNQLGEYEEKNMKVLGDGLKQLPGGLQAFKLDVSFNNLELRQENMDYLQEGLEQLPQGLRDLELDLSFNELGEFQEDVKFIGKLPQNLRNLFLDLSGTKIWENMEYFVQSMKQLPCNLQRLELGLKSCDLGMGKGERMKLFRVVLKQLPINLKKFVLGLEKNYLDIYESNMMCFGDGIKLLPKTLQYLKLKLNENELKWDKLKQFEGQIRQDLPNLKVLDMNL